MKKLSIDETDLTGQWHFVNGKMISDETDRRIAWLIRNELVRIGHDESGWYILYRDPNDGRLWELTYPQSHMHGGGPRRLTVIDKDKARVKYSRVYPYLLEPDS